MKLSRTLLTVMMLFGATVFAADKEICVYLDANGQPKMVEGRRAVPDRFRAQAQCMKGSETNQYLAQPGDVTLKGNIRQEQIGSALGHIALRWPRTAEVLFGRTPQRAMTDAANTVSRVLRMSGFAPELQSLSLPWEVVFMDEDVPEKQIPSYLVSNCHPAWMTPPANLYIVAQRVVAGCGGGRPQGSSQVADAELSQVLIHEMGHAVEYALLKGRGEGDRMRAEGFACWFEQYASDFSSVNRKGAAKHFYTQLARISLKESPEQFVFGGSAYDYARAGLFFHAIVAKRGIRGLMQVYEVLRESNSDLFSATKAVLGWDREELNRQAAAQAS